METGEGGLEGGGRERKGKRGGGVHEPVGWREGGLGGRVDVEGVEGGFGGVGEGEARCVEWGGHGGGHCWQGVRWGWNDVEMTQVMFAQFGKVVKNLGMMFFIDYSLIVQTLTVQASYRWSDRVQRQVGISRRATSERYTISGRF